MRSRDLTRLAATTYDVLVIGGGIYGLTIAYEAASRGLRTALVDARDFGSGASFNHQKTVHGGLRSLQSASLRARSARASSNGARWRASRPGSFARFRSSSAPTAPRRADGLRSQRRSASTAGWAAIAMPASNRNCIFPLPRLISKAATLRLFPGIKPDKLTGAAQWYDYQMVEADRLTLAFADAADRSGADLANYAAAVAPIRTGSRVSGMTVRDVLTATTISVNAAIVINAAGGAAGSIMQAFGVSRRIPLLRAINLVTSKPASDMALGGPHRRRADAHAHAVAGTRDRRHRPVEDSRRT